MRKKPPAVATKKRVFVLPSPPLMVLGVAVLGSAVTFVISKVVGF